MLEMGVDCDGVSYQRLHAGSSLINNMHVRKFLRLLLPCFNQFCFSLVLFFFCRRLSILGLSGLAVCQTTRPMYELYGPTLIKYLSSEVVADLGGLFLARLIAIITGITLRIRYTCRN